MTEGNKKLKVLVVEDDGPSRMVLATLARDEGHEVQEAQDGAEGLKLFESFAPDLVFADIAMPVMDGLEMLEKIRRKSQDAIVIMTTAFSGAEFTLKALRLRANDYLVKPIVADNIEAILRKYAGILAARTVEREVLGMILHRELSMKLGNNPDVVNKVVDRLMQETEGLIPSADRLRTHLGLVEILVNAIEHGNLGITYDEKTSAMEMGSGFVDLIRARQSQEPYRSRNVLVQFRLDQDGCEWKISDEGDGFDWQSIPDPNDPENLLASHGRGIMLTRLSFDDVRYLGKGNQVILRKNFSAPETERTDNDAGKE